MRGPAQGRLDYPNFFWENEQDNRRCSHFPLKFLLDHGRPVDHRILMDHQSQYFHLELLLGHQRLGDYQIPSIHQRNYSI